MDKDGYTRRVYLDLPLMQGKTSDGHEFLLSERDGRINVLAYGNVYTYEVIEIHKQGEKQESDDVQHDGRYGMEPWELDAEEDYPD